MEPIPFIGVGRHRIGVDGKGVTTLAAFHGCPLRCRYCLNPMCLKPPEGLFRYTPESLYDRVRIDNLYFLATGGGICFGGGEPLLRSDFLQTFRSLCGDAWRLTVETSLNVPNANVEAATSVIDDFIVDIKDMEPVIYKKYTGQSNRCVIDNLHWLLENKGAEALFVRVPLIPNYNTEKDVDDSVQTLKDMGIKNIERFTYVVRENRELKTI